MQLSFQLKTQTDILHKETRPICIFPTRDTPHVQDNTNTESERLENVTPNSCSSNASRNNYTYMRQY